MSDYLEKLQHPKWQKKRLKIMERAGFKCESCGDTEETLQIHHLVYCKGEPWDSPDEHLECLCRGCHEFREDFNIVFERSLVPTRICLNFARFYWNAFDSEQALALKAVDEKGALKIVSLYKVCLEHKYKTKFSVTVKEIKPEPETQTQPVEAKSDSVAEPALSPR